MPKGIDVINKLKNINKPIVYIDENLNLSKTTFDQNNIPSNQGSISSTFQRIGRFGSALSGLTREPFTKPLNILRSSKNRPEWLSKKPGRPSWSEVGTFLSKGYGSSISNWASDKLARGNVLPMTKTDRYGYKPQFNKGAFEKGIQRGMIGAVQFARATKLGNVIKNVVQAWKLSGFKQPKGKNTPISGSLPPGTGTSTTALPPGSSTGGDLARR